MALDSLHSLRPERTKKCDFSGGITDEQTDRQMDRQIDWRTDIWTDRWMNNGWTDAFIEMQGRI